MYGTAEAMPFPFVIGAYFFHCAVEFAGPSPLGSLSLPHDHAHSVEEACSDFDAWGAGFAQHRAHFFHGVRLADGSRGVVARYATLVERESGVGEREVDRVADQVIDHECVAADAQGFARRLNDLVRRQMMQEQFAANE